MSLKHALLFALDVSPSISNELLDDGRRLCQESAAEKIVFAPSDELGLVLTGTSSSRNPLFSQPDGGSFAHMVVDCALEPPTTEFLTSLASLESVRSGAMAGTQSSSAGHCDILKTIQLCAHLLHQRTAGKKFRRTIFFVTDAAHEVAHKEEVVSIVQELQRDEIELMVVIHDLSYNPDPTLAPESHLDGDWSALSVKQQNERVLHYLCATCGETSMVISSDEAWEGMHALRKRKVLQRPLAKLVLSVGDIRLATQLFTKASTEPAPTFLRVTATGEPVKERREYLRVGATPGEEEATGTSCAPIDERDRIKAYRYGRSLIPCTDADLEAMRMTGPRGVDGVAFVPLDEVPPFVLMGGVKVLLPLFSDVVGQRGFSTLVKAMIAEKKALLVRWVGRQDAQPVLGICIPSSTPKREALYLAPCPFTEDCRLYRFGAMEDITFTDAEEKRMDQLVHDMTVEKDVLRPNESFNPTIQHHRATILHRLLNPPPPPPLATTSSGNDAGDDSAKAAPTMPPLQEELRKTTAMFGHPSNVLHPYFTKVQDQLEALATAFPFDASYDPVARKEHNYWFRGQQQATMATTTEPASAHGVDPAEAMRASTSALRMGSTSSTHTEPATGIQRVRGVEPMDPVGEFRALVAANPSDPAACINAMNTLVDVIFRCLQLSAHGSHLDTCDCCVKALRAYCVERGNPEYFNTFLIQLMDMSMVYGHEKDYWVHHVLQQVQSMGPITRTECPKSSLANEMEASAFLSRDRVLGMQGGYLDNSLLDVLA